MLASLIAEAATVRPVARLRRELSLRLMLNRRLMAGASLWGAPQLCGLQVRATVRRNGGKTTSGIQGTAEICHET